MVKKYYLIHFLDFLSKVLRKMNFPKFLCQKYNSIVHSIVEKKLRPYFNKAYSNVYDFNKNKSCNNNVIWIFWWQQIQNAPIIVKRCVQSIEHHANGHPIIIINKNNLDKYTNIPRYIYQDLYQHKITFTHFSDILRFNLLRNHGGLWIDSTVFCTSNIRKKFSKFYTSGGYSNPYNFYISSKWTGFLMGGNKNNPLFIFMDEFFRLYWKTHKYLIDYFLIDYALNYAYLYNIGGFKKYVNSIAYKNNPHLHDLQKVLNMPYNNKLFNKLKSNTKFFKLSYKMKFKNNKNTFYYKIVSNNKKKGC